MRTHPPRSAAVLAAALSVALFTACSDGSTAPSGISSAALDYLNQALDWEQDVSYYSAQLDWPSIRKDVIAHAGAAQKPADTYDAITYSIQHYLRPLGDGHSEFWPPTSAPGRADSPANDIHYQIVPSTTIAPKIAYLQFPSYTGTNDVGHADSLVAALRTLDATQPCGWILDLRTNLGGTWAVMLSTLNSFIGNGTFLGAVASDNSRATFFAQNGVTGLVDVSSNTRYTFFTPNQTFTPARSKQPVALLQGINTASAGEMILLAFRGSGTPFRTFGAPSRGVTSLPAGLYLKPDSAYLNITTAIMTDRTGQLWGTAVAPDQAVTSGNSWPTAAQATDPVVQAAVTWLNSRVECGGTVSSDRTPSSIRIPLPSNVRDAGPNDPRPRISKYLGVPASR